MWDVREMSRTNARLRSIFSVHEVLGGTEFVLRREEWGGLYLLVQGEISCCGGRARKCRLSCAELQDGTKQVEMACKQGDRWDEHLSQEFQDHVVNWTLAVLRLLPPLAIREKADLLTLIGELVA